jgi:hypothetical protein
MAITVDRDSFGFDGSVRLSYLRATFAAHQRYLIETVRGDLSDLLHEKTAKEPVHSQAF